MHTHRPIVCLAVAALFASTLLLAGSTKRAPAPRRTFCRGERATVRLDLTPAERAGTALVFRGVTVPGSWRVKVGTDGAVTIDTGRYRVGDYEVACVRGKTVEHAWPIYIRPAARPEVWFGNFTGRPARTGNDAYVQRRDLGMNAAYLYGMNPDDALREGVYLAVHGNALRGSLRGLNKAKAAKLMQVYRNCRGTAKPSKSPCMRNPEVIRRAVALAVDQVKDLVGHPGLLGIGVDDEVSMRGYDWNDTGGVTCYCDSCRAQWKRKTGHDAPTPPCLPPGTVVPDDNSYLKYMLEWTGWADYYGPAEADYNRTVAKALHALRRDLVVFQTPGAAFGEMDVVHPEIYSLWFSTPATHALATMSLSRALQQARYGRPKPIWPLIGWFQRVPAPQWSGDYIAAQSRMCLAEGAKSIWLTLMYWYDSRGRHKPTMLHGAEHVAPAVRRIARLLERFGPALVRVEPVRYPVAVLYSRTTQGLQRVIDPATIAAAKARGSWMEVAWEHMQATHMGFAALLRAGAPAEFITEDDVLGGRLENYGALVLLDHKYARQSVVDRINRYAAGTGVVLADRGSPIKPKQAKPLPFDSSQFTRMVNLGLRAPRVPAERLEIVMQRTTGLEREWALLARPVLATCLPDDVRRVTSDDLDVIVRRGRSGDVDYVYVLSTDATSEQSATVSAHVRGRYAYDLLAGDTAALAVVDGVLRVRTTLDPGGWRVFAVTAKPIGGVALKAAMTGGTVRVGCAVVAGDGTLVRGAFPIELTVLGPRGRALPYGRYLGTDAGRAVHAFTPALNDPRGKWTLRATHLATGHSAETTVVVKR